MNYYPGERLITAYEHLVVVVWDLPEQKQVWCQSVSDGFSAGPPYRMDYEEVGRI